MPKYNIEVQLSGRDGNAFNVMANVTGAMKKAKVPKEEIDSFIEEATSGDYDHLLQTCMKWVTVN